MPIETEFWSAPDGDQLVHVMDGLDLGAHRIFLYGNNWPKKYAEVIEKKGHPVYGAQYEEIFGGYRSSIPMKSGELPLTIRTESVNQKRENIIYHISGLEETFEYEDGRVVDYTTRAIYNPEAIEKYGISTKPEKESIVENELPLYVYEGDNLIQYNSWNAQYKYFYENNRLARAEFHATGKMRNHRLYHYNEQGLKEKTEIFNTYGEPEYTIEYHYDFYEES